MSNRPITVCFPREDSRFAERIQTLIEDAHPQGPLAAAVQALLRETYPMAVIHTRDALAAFDGETLWYAYRDGSVVPMADAEST